ncbi:MAG: prepilin-type N-terminal cleavage/methylation domain-containing protein [Deltaproteobacteria bacterium]|nr:prepilin-type N-terminal cleavage/methylation domain-containing protein [Deltaproteobacteria bacterium]
MKRKAGFTLVEIIMVIILLGILGILGTLGLNSAVSSDSGMYERQFESAIRYAQNYAMSHFTYTAIVFSASGSSPSCTLGNSSTSYSGYAVCACNAATSSLVPLTNPLAQTASNFYVSMNYGISYSVSGISTNYIAFNSEGQSGTSFFKSSCGNSFTALASAAIVSFGSLPNQSFSIYPTTGLVSYNGKLM